MGRKVTKSTETRPVSEPTPQPPPTTSTVVSASTSATSSSFSDDDPIQTTATATSPVSTHHSDSESDSGSDTDKKNPSSIPTKPVSDESESDSDITPPSPKPVPRSKPDNSKRVDKRPAETTPTAVSVTKRVKKDSTSKKPTEPEKKTDSGSVLALPSTPGKVLFQRLWSDEDELIILKGLVDYKEKNGVDPMMNVDDFALFIKKSLTVVDANKTQIASKVRRLKKRFVNSLNNKKKISDPHQMKVLELSRRVWSSDSVEEVAVAAYGEEAIKKANVALKKAKHAKEAKEKANVVEKKTSLGEKSGIEDVGVDVEVGLGFDEESLLVLRKAMKKVQGDERKEIKTMVEKANVAYLDAYVLRLKVLQRAAKNLLDGIENDQC